MKPLPLGLAALLGLSLLGNLVLIAKFRRTDPRQAGPPTTPANAAVDPLPPTIPPPVAPAPAAPAGDGQEDVAALRKRIAKLEKENALYLKWFQEEHPGASLVAGPDPVEPGDNPLAREAHGHLSQTISVAIADRPALELIELIRKECGVEFIYDPAVESRLRTQTVTLAGNLGAMDALQIMGSVLGFTIEYLNDKVWIRFAPEEK